MGVKVLFVASEVSPYAKSGGLGDVAGSLPKALKAAGMDVKVICPKYKDIKPELIEDIEYVGSFAVNTGWRAQGASVYLKKGNVDIYFIENDFYFGRNGYYGYGDDNERFAFFSRAVLDSLNIIDFIPDIIHCNDWQTGPVCLYLKDVYRNFDALANTKSIFTIHNLQYQGNFDPSTLGYMELDGSYNSADRLEFNGRISFMKAGIFYSDYVTTVSRTYAHEIQTPQYGYGFDGILRCRREQLFGIVNGIDYDENNPETSKKIYTNFSAENKEGKRENKRRLQKELNLNESDKPMFSLISRLVDQKGIDLVISCLDELMFKDTQVVILGTGDGRYEHIFRECASRYPGKISANILFDDTLAQKIYAGSDMFLMPSLFEPCGLGQLFAMSYGTVPIARTTGGLVDTVEDYNFETGKGNGFVFHDYIPSGLMWAINMSLKAYYEPNHWDNVVNNAFAARFSWERSAKEYEKLYNNLMQ